MASTITALTGGGGVAVAGDTSGVLELKTNNGTTAVTISTSQVVTLANALPVASGGTGLTAAGTSGNALVSDGTNWTSGKQTITSGTAVSASGTSIDFTGIPSWVKRITVMFNGVSTNGTTSFQIQLGDSGGIETTGYISSNTSAVSSTSGLLVTQNASAANTYQGSAIISLLGTNTWVYQSVLSRNDAFTFYGAGSKTLSDILTQVRITTVGGTDTFDAGSINILYE